MADLSTLNNLNPVEPLDLDDYADAKEFQGIPTKGVYTVQAKESFAQEDIGSTQEGNAIVSVDPKIVDGPNAGYVLRFTKVSAKQFRRGNKVASKLGDYLRACGIRGKYASQLEQVEAACDQTPNKLFKVLVDWRAYNGETGYQLKGMERFPADGNGGHLPYCEDPGAFEVDELGATVKDDEGNPVHKRLWARAFVDRFIAAE